MLNFQKRRSAAIVRRFTETIKNAVQQHPTITIIFGMHGCPQLTHAQLRTYLDAASADLGERTHLVCDAQDGPVFMIVGSNVQTAFDHYLLALAVFIKEDCIEMNEARLKVDSLKSAVLENEGVCLQGEIPDADDVKGRPLTFLEW